LLSIDGAKLAGALRNLFAQSKKKNKKWDFFSIQQIFRPENGEEKPQKTHVFNSTL